MKTKCYSGLLMACLLLSGCDFVTETDSNRHESNSHRKHGSQKADFHSNSHEKISPRKHGGQKADFHSEDIKQASTQYRQTQDMESLQTLHKQLKPGMPRNEVEALLGAAQYSPTEGVDYYPAAQDSLQQQSANTGLVVEYINEQDQTTDQVQRFWLGEVGE